MGSRVQILIALLLIIFTPLLSLSAELIHTVQIGSHQSEERAKRQYRTVSEVLNEEDRDSLRIETIGDYYALRIGDFPTHKDAAGFLEKIKTLYPGARTMTAYISNNKLIQMYRPAGEEAAAIAVLPLQGKPEIVPAEKENEFRPDVGSVEKKAEPPQVEVEALVATIPVPEEEQVVVLAEKKVELPHVEVDALAATILVQKGEPEIVLAEKEIASLQVEIEAPALGLLVSQEEPAIVSDEVKAEDSPSVTPAEGKLPAAVVDISPVEPVVAVAKVAAKGAEARTTISSRQLIIIVSTLILIALIFSVRALKSRKTDPLRSAAAEKEQSAETTEEHSVALAAASVEVPDTVEEERPLAQETVGAEESMHASVAGPEDANAAEVVAVAESSAAADDSLISVMRGLRGVTTSAVEKGVAVAELLEATVVDSPDAGCAAPAAVGAGLINPPTAAFPDNKKAESPEEERQNRVSRAMEAAVQARNNRK